MAVYTEIDQEWALGIAENFQLGELHSFDGIAKGSVNTNYRFVTSEGIFFVRIDERRNRSDLEYETELLRYLSGAGFPTPAPRPNLHGHRFQSFRQKLVMVFPYFDGADKPAADFSHDELETAGRILRELHTLGAGFERSHRNRFSLRAVADRWQRAEPEVQSSELVQLEIDALTEDWPYVEQTTIHGDLFADNLLWTGPNVLSGVLDFEAATRGAPAFDVATAINALAWVEGEPIPDPSRIEALRAGYGEDPPELLWYLRCSALRFTITRILDFELTPPPPGGRVEQDYTEYVKRLIHWRGEPEL